ncbi:MAG: PQQ-binding-like beta-propeller repeat protein [Gemmataceae bacterium]
MFARVIFVLFAGLIGVAFARADDAKPGAKREALWAAVRSGDVKAIQAALDQGANINARNEYGVSALWIAAGSSKTEVVDFLVRKGANVNARDEIWYQTPLSAAVSDRKLDTVKLLIKAGAKDTDAAFFSAVRGGNLPMAQTIQELAKTIDPETLDASLFFATNAEMKAFLEKAGAKVLPKTAAKEQQGWDKLVGKYESDGGSRLIVEIKDDRLLINARPVKTSADGLFVPYGPPGSHFQVVRKNGAFSHITMKLFTAEYSYYRFKEPVKSAANTVISNAKVSTPMPWPSFRGPNGTGIADGQQPPVAFDGKKNVNVRWKAKIDGLGHSCPAVWGNRVFITTAISSKEADPKIRVGNYGDVESVDDTSKHTWQVMCLDSETGKVLDEDGFRRTPKIKRHLKGSQANCTPATDGQHVVACFGSEGLYCYDMDGKLLWKRDLSTLDSSFSLDREYEWGFGNSPVLHEGMCILQCDLSRDSFIAAFNLSDGQKVWSTPRDEIPSWSSPVIWKNAKRTEIVTNAAQFARGYDPKTGEELWRLAKKSECTIPTPVLGKDLVFVSSGNRPIQPIIAIKAGAKGDISLKENQKSNEFVAWGTQRGGPYMPTPILYGKYFYTCSNSGILACYDAASGKEVYKERMGGTSYTASPVAADGRLYFTSEQGEVRVVKAGPEFELLAVNEIGDYCLPTPAISNGKLFVRSQHYLWAFGEK